MQRAGHDGVRTIDLRLMSRWNLREGMDMNHDTAASDLIAAVALIAVFVTVAAIVGVTVFSSLQGDAPPAAGRSTSTTMAVTRLNGGGLPSWLTA